MLTEILFGLALLTAIILPRLKGGFGLQLVSFVALAAITVYVGYLPLWLGALLALAPVIFLALLVGYYYWLGRRALSGKMGDGQKWVAEFVRDDDLEFIEAVQKLDRMEMQEVIVVADSKQELKELAVERAAEQNTEPVGE